MSYNLTQEDKPQKPYNPKGEELDVKDYLEKRIPILKATKKNILNGIDYEQIMRDADEEYQPKIVDKKKGKTAVVPSEETGNRNLTIVNIPTDGSDEWRSTISEPTLFAKVQTAVAILMGQNLDATFKANLKRYKSNTSIAKAIWKRNWNLKENKTTLGLFEGDLAKYGWGIGRTYPRIIKNKGKVCTSIDKDNPENNKFKEVDIVEFNDIFRERLDPYRTWIDDMTNLSDPFSQDDWYFEKDYSKDAFDVEFGNYTNADKLTFGKVFNENGDGDDLNGETTERDDIITLGFYESKKKDLYSIYAPSDKVVVYHSPLPNDDKKLSCWWSYWNVRDPRTPYGIGLYEIIKQDKVLYDRLKNMKIDQIVMAIYPMLFSTGQSKDETIVISPGLIKQKKAGTTIEQVKIEFDSYGWDGVDRQQESMDNNSAITPTLAGKIEGKTLGETLQAKDSALRKLSTPLENIARAIETDAYITLSWSNQTLSLPEIKQFVDEKELALYEKANGTKADYTNTGDDGKITADFLSVIDLGLGEDDKGVLVENPEDRFFQITRKSSDELTQMRDSGQDVSELLPVQSIKWDGIISIDARSIVAPSHELEKQSKIELFNIVMSQLNILSDTLSGNPAMGIEPNPEKALDLMKPIKQILETQDEKPENWLPTALVKLDENPEALAQMKKAKAQAENPLIIPPTGQPQMGGQAGQPGQFKPIASTVKPRTNVTNPMRRVHSDMSKMFQGS